MPSKPPERRAIGYMSPERRLEVDWRKKRRELRSLVVSWPLLSPIYPRHVLYARPAYRVLALLIKRMFPVKHILFVKRIFSCCRVL